MGQKKKKKVSKEEDKGLLKAEVKSRTVTFLTNKEGAEILKQALEKILK